MATLLLWNTDERYKVDSHDYTFIQFLCIAISNEVNSSTEKFTFDWDYHKIQFLSDVFRHRVGNDASRLGLLEEHIFTVRERFNQNNEVANIDDVAVNIGNAAENVDNTTETVDVGVDSVDGDNESQADDADNMFKTIGGATGCTEIVTANNAAGKQPEDLTYCEPVVSFFTSLQFFLLKQ